LLDRIPLVTGDTDPLTKVKGVGLHATPPADQHSLTRPNVCSNAKSALERPAPHHNDAFRWDRHSCLPRVNMPVRTKYSNKTMCRRSLHTGSESAHLKNMGQAPVRPRGMPSRRRIGGSPMRLCPASGSL